MKTAPLPHNEPGRLYALRNYDILDTPPEPAFDDLTRLASQICGAPIALISLVDAKRQWFKSRIGLDLQETSRDLSFCSHAILETDLFLVEDATQDPRFADNPLVTDGPKIRFYAGMPLITPSGHAVGTLCIIDHKPRTLTPAQVETLRILSQQALTQLELRHKLAELKRTVAQGQHAQEALRRAEAKYRSIFENVAEGIFQTTADGQYLAVNPMLARIYGYDSPDELMEAISDIEHQLYVDPNRRAEFARTMQENGTVSTFESQVYRKDKSIIWISENARAVRDASGDLLYYEGTVQDVTERKQTEDALRNSEVLYHSLVENLPQNIFRKDRGGRFTFANRRFCATLQRSLAEIIGKSDFDFFPRELAEKYHRDDLRVIDELRIFETIEEHQTPDRGKIYVEVIKAPLYDHSGRVVGIQGIFWDVTERKKIEEDLAYERDLLTALLDNVPDSIYFKDAQSRFIKCSKALARRFGLSDPNEAVGKSDFDFFSREHAMPAFEDEARIIQSGQPIIGKPENELWLDGRESWALTTKMPLRNREGKIIGTFGVSKDITSLKQAEDVLAKARDAALESARLKAEFLANVSHEIRTPMNAIIGMSGLLMDTELTEEQREFSNTIRDSADSLLAIINDILDFSKMEAGKLTFETIDFDLHEIVEGTLEILAERAISKEIELASSISEETPVSLRGDPGRLRQVLMNLVGNAVKFTEKGEVVVEVSKDEETEQSVTLRFVVRDTGIGIPEKSLSHLFKAFTQADGSMARKYGGTGLGLAIVKQMVERMEGRVGVESKVGQGSRFWFTARFEKQPVPLHDVALAAESEKLIGIPILVVDDNETQRSILEHQLRAFRMKCHSAKDTPEAVELLTRQAAAGEPFKIAMLDIQLEETDGLSLARQIKSNSTIAGIRLILLTALGSRLDPEELEGAGIEACLFKPFRQSRLIETLTNIAVRQSKAGREPEATDSCSIREQSGVPGPLRAIRVLLAEDNIVNRRMALRQLQKLGYPAEAVSNGLEVLKALHSAEFDVILMDCQMPEMDGYRTTSEIRRLESQSGGRDERRRHYIVAMTANALRSDRAKCLEVGMDDYISKPVRLADLQAALQKAARSIDLRSARPAMDSPVDRTVLQDLADLRRSGEPDPVLELIELYLRDAGTRIEGMESALQQGDSNGLVHAAHGLKGSSSNLGAPRLAGLCGQLEKEAAKSGAPAVLQRLVDEVKGEFGRVRATLIEETKGRIA